MMVSNKSGSPQNHNRVQQQRKEGDELQRDLANLRLQLAKQNAELEAARKDRQSAEDESAAAKSMLKALQMATADAKRATEEQTGSLRSQVEDVKKEGLRLKAEEAEARKQRESLEARMEELLHKTETWKTQAIESTSKNAVLADERRMQWQIKLEEARVQKDAAEREREKARAQLSEIELTSREAIAEVERLTQELKLLQETLAKEQEAAGSRTNSPSSQREEDGKSPQKTQRDRRVASPDAEDTRVDLWARLAECEDIIADNQLEISRLESEVEQWMSASEQLQKLGEDAVIEVMQENDSFKSEIDNLLRSYEAELKRRQRAEKELSNATMLLSQLEARLANPSPVMTPATQHNN